MNENDLADILADCLDSIEHGERTFEECLTLYPEHREELTSLLGTATRVWQHANYAPRPSFRLTSRARLLRRLHSRASTALRPSRKLQPTALKRLIPLWATLTVMIVSLLGVGTVYASSEALPGDTLYPVKLSVEDTRLLLADDTEDVALASEFARIRLEEIQDLVNANRQVDLELAVTLFSDRIMTASDALELVAQNDPDLATRLGLEFEQALSRHTEQLTQLLETAPEAAKPAIANAIRVSNRGQGTIHQLIERNRPGGPPENLPGPAQDSPGGGPPEGNPGHDNQPGGGPPDELPNSDDSSHAPGRPDWAQGGNP